MTQVNADSADCLFGAKIMGIKRGTLICFCSFLLLLGTPLACIILPGALFSILVWFAPSFSHNILNSIDSFGLVSVPLIIQMMAILGKSGMTRDLFKLMRPFGWHLRGGVAVQILLVGMWMGAIYGDVLLLGFASGAILLLGVMVLAQRFSGGRAFVIGTFCVDRVLYLVLTPSAVLIIYGLITEIPIGGLFSAAVIPGSILMGLYVAYILMRVYRNPNFITVIEFEKTPRAEVLRLTKGLVLPPLLVTLLFGLIYFGITTEVETEVIGVLGLILITVIRREFTWAFSVNVACQTLVTATVILWINICAKGFDGAAYAVIWANSASTLIAGATDNLTIIVFLMMVLLFVLGISLAWIWIVLLRRTIFVPFTVNVGMFSVCALMAPLMMLVFVPAVTGLGMDIVWFGVVFAMSTQVGFLPLPFGPAVFYQKVVAPDDVTLGEIFQSLLPFIALQIFTLGLLLMFPGITGR